MDKLLKNYNKIFFVGIGGISMSGLAILLKHCGKQVLGSDLVKTELTKKLKQQGIKVFYKHKIKNIKNCDLIVYSGAISKNNCEIEQAYKNNIKVIERSELLFLISSEYKNVIAVSGSHGKTTITAMIGYIFKLCGLNPTIHLGGEIDFLNGNVCCGGKEYFITEACEFRDSFLRLKPQISIISNIEKEHLDYFKTFNIEKKSFNNFVKNTLKLCIINEKYLKYIKCNNITNIKTFGFSNNANLVAKNIRKDEDGKYYFDCYKDDVYLDSFKLNIYGKHNINNALATIFVCLNYGISSKVIKLGLKTFVNSHRRFEVIGNYKNNMIVSDYAHHPTEIKATINTAKEVFNKKIVCVFQPHTYSRTKLLISSFKKCFNGVDKLYLLKTYSAREKFDFKGSCEYLMSCLQQQNNKYEINGVYALNKFNKIFKKEEINNSVILFIGAGDISKLPKMLIK